jgi:hypothetical protein
MYNYYRNAVECYIYLADVPGSLEGSSLSRDQQLRAVRSSVWFTRGWTLQELIAPSTRTFYAQDWSPIPVAADLLTLIAEVTGVELDLLQDRELLPNYCVAKRMSWASARKTTRPEDMVYCLMGIFNVNMPVLYGEGAEKAFVRLQKEIINNSFDQTIFIWRGPYDTSGLLAKSPSDFANTPPLRLWPPFHLVPFNLTNVGLHARLYFRGPPELGLLRLAGMQCDLMSEDNVWKVVFIRLRLLPGVDCAVNGKMCNVYRRVDCEELKIFSSTTLAGCVFEEALVLQDDQYNLVNRSTVQHNSRWGTEHSVDPKWKFYKLGALIE